MTETNDILKPEELWASLAEHEKEACIYFAVSDWKTGVGKDFTQAMGIEDKTLDELVNRKVLEAKPTWKMFGDLADGLKSEVEAIRIKMKDFTYSLKDSERTVLQDFDRFTSIAERKEETPRYHLSDFSFHEYLKSMEDSE